MQQHKRSSFSEKYDHYSAPVRTLYACADRKKKLSSQLAPNSWGDQLSSYIKLANSAQYLSAQLGYIAGQFSHPQSNRRELRGFGVEKKENFQLDLDLSFSSQLFFLCQGKE